MARRFPWQERSQKVSDFLHFLVCDRKKRSQGCFPNCVKRRIVGNTRWNLIHIFAASLSCSQLCHFPTLLLCHLATLLVTPDVTFTSQLGTTDRFPPATFSNFSALDKTQNSLFGTRIWCHRHTSQTVLLSVGNLTFLQNLCSCTLRSTTAMLYLDIMVVTIPCH